MKPKTKPSALVAEDNELHQKTIQRILRTAGWEVKCTGDGAKALEMAVNAPATADGAFDVLIFDHRMPHILGLDVVKRLRELKVTTPVVMVTNFPSPEFSTQARKAGVFRVLLSPVNDITLLSTVDRALAETALATAAQPDAPNPA